MVSPGFVDTPLTRKNDFAMPGRVSVDRAVAAIRHGLAKGKNHIAFPTGFSLGPAAAGQSAIGYPAPAVAQDGALMNIAIIGSGIAGLTCAPATGRTPSGNAVRSGRHAGRPHRHRGCRHAAGHWAIDTGFIVYNDRTYPRFMGLLSELGIGGQKRR